MLKKAGKQQKIIVRNDFYRAAKVRLLLVDDAIETAVFRDPAKKYELVSPYLDQLSYAFSARPGIKKTLLIGGGGFAYPGYYISHYPDRIIDVVEINSEMIRLAREEFYLGDLLEEYGSERLRIFNEDAFAYLLRSDQQYDFIVDDAYIGRKASGGVRSRDGIRLMRAHLSKGGILAINIVTALKGPRSLHGRRTERMVRSHFRYVTLIPCEDHLGPYEMQNCLIFASDEEL